MEKNMDLIEVDLANKRQIKLFLDLPFRLYSKVSAWVPPLEPDARLNLNPRKHPFYSHGSAVFYLAMNNNQPVGRLAVLENDNYNQYNLQRTAFFYLFECEDQLEASSMMFDAAFGWARKRGLDRIEGPRGFTVFDGLGMLVSGFEHRPAFGLPYNLPYYPQLVEAAGFRSKIELVSGYLDRDMQFPEKFHRAAELIKRRRKLSVTQYRTRQEIKALAPYLKELYNSSSVPGEDNIPLTDADVQALANQMMWFADPRLIKIVMKEDKPVGFLFAYPDISKAIQRVRGRIYPFGWLILLLELWKTRWININGAGMLPGYHGIGGTALLFDELYKSMLGSRYQFADIVQIGVENGNMQREMRDFGIDFYKTHRVYEKDLFD
jgi:hypothetical protein